jgi:hypothetical protein
MLASATHLSHTILPDPPLTFAAALLIKGMSRSFSRRYLALDAFFSG